MKALVVPMISMILGSCESNVDITSLKLRSDPLSAEIGESIGLSSSFAVQAGDDMTFSSDKFQSDLVYVANFTLADGAQNRVALELESDLKLADGEKEETASKLEKPSLAKIKIPESLKIGINTVSITVKNQQISSFFFLFHELGETLPFYSGQLSEICSNKSYVNQTGAKITGTLDCATGLLIDCSEDNQTDCAATPDFPSVDKTVAVASNIKSGITLAGTLGTHEGPPADCSTDGETGCVTLAAFKAAEVAGLAAKVKTGVSVAGETGTYPSSGNLLTGASATADLDSASFDTQIKSAAAFEYFDAEGTRHTGAGDLDIAAGNIATGSDIFGTAGSVTAAPADCSSDGATGCVTTASYKSATISGLAAKVKTGVTVAGETGTYPSSGNLLTGASATADLDSSTFDAKVKSATAFEYFDAEGTRYTGAGDADIIAANLLTGATIFGTSGSVTASPGSCSSDGATGCVTTASYKSADVSLALAGNIRSGVTLAGTAGSVTVSPADCSSDGATGCVTTASYKSATIAGLAAKVKTGVSVAGETGSYPSSGNLLTGASATADLDSSTFNAQVKSATAFEYFDGEGTRYTGAGDSDIVVANIASGTNIFGTAGTAVLSPADCAADGGTSCVAVASFPAADKSLALGANIKSGITLAGTAGSLTGAPADCSADGATGCVTVAAYKAADSSLALAGNIKSGITLAGTLGTHQGAPVDCAADGGTSCVAVASFPAADKSLAIGANIKSGITLAGTAGSLSPAPADCSSDGATGCVTVAAYKSATIAGLASKVLSTAGVAGVTGNVTLPDVNNVLQGSGTFGVSGTSLTPALTLPAVGNVWTGSGSYGNPSSVLTPTLVLPTNTNVLSGSGVYGNPASWTSPSLTDHDDWDMETAFPGAGNFDSISNVPLAAEVCNTATFNGSAGTASCGGGGSFQSYMGSFTHHDKAAVAPGIQVTLAAELGTAVTTKPAGYREITKISKDDFGTPTTASVNAVVRSATEWNAGIPRLVCGKAATSIANKIVNCDSEHSASRPTWDLISGDTKLMWQGEIQGNASEGSWTLVSVYHPSSADGVTCDASCTELWRDERTGMIWSDSLANGGTTTFNWCHATGSNNNDIAGNPYAEDDPSNYCDSATYQVQTSPTLPISLCAEDPSYLDTPSYTNNGKGGLRWTGTTPAVRWKLPTVHDQAQAMFVNGGYYVLPNSFAVYWSSSVRSNNRSYAWNWSGSYGSINSFNRNGSVGVRCIGRP